MDVLAHALWAGIGIAMARRRIRIAPRTAAAAIALAVVPDVVHMLPVVGWVATSDAALAIISAYAMALPGGEPAMPAWVGLYAHHFHCLMHSAIVATIATAIAMTFAPAARRGWLVALAGWWSHIIIDVFTHSADFYPSPVLYPLTMAGFHGIAWNEPWFIALNYAALVAAAGWLALSGAARGSR